MKLLVATRSPGKMREILALFTGLPFTVVFPADCGLERHPDEDDLEGADSYAENAVAKARYFAERTGLPTCADDSGLEVDALGGQPGPRSARWAALAGRSGPDPDAANIALLLERLAGVPDAARTARYRCVVAYLETPTAVPELVEATCDGHVLPQPRGAAGFGYDPVFFSSDLQQGFGEAPAAAKQRVSHRGRAFRALIEVLLRRVGA